MKKKQIQGIIIILGIVMIMAYIFFLSPIAPFASAPVGSIVGERVRLPGILGFLGFYRHPYDNRHTFFLLSLFGFMAIGRVVGKAFLKPNGGKRK